MLQRLQSAIIALIIYRTEGADETMVGIRFSHQGSPKSSEKSVWWELWKVYPAWTGSVEFIHDDDIKLYDSYIRSAYFQMKQSQPSHISRELLVGVMSLIIHNLWLCYLWIKFLYLKIEFERLKFDYQELQPPNRTSFASNCIWADKIVSLEIWKFHNGMYKWNIDIKCNLQLP